MVRLSLTRKLEALEDLARPSATSSEQYQRQERLQAILAADPEYGEVMAVINQFDSPINCLADPEGRNAAKAIAGRLAAANTQLEEETDNG